MNIKRLFNNHKVYVPAIVELFNMSFYNAHVRVSLYCIFRSRWAGNQTVKSILYIMVRQR